MNTKLAKDPARSTAGMRTEPPDMEEDQYMLIGVRKYSNRPPEEQTGSQYGSVGSETLAKGSIAESLRQTQQSVHEQRCELGLIPKLCRELESQFEAGRRTSASEARATAANKNLTFHKNLLK